MANFGPLTAKIGLSVWANPANFNGFRVLPSLLQRRRSPDANQTLRDVWPSTGLLHCIHFRGLLLPDRILPGEKFTLRPSLVFFYIGSVTAWHALKQRASTKLCGVVHGMELGNFRRGRHLYSAGRPSRWASSHILVQLILQHIHKIEQTEFRSAS